MKIALLGFDVEGRAAYDYWNRPENTITICDLNPTTEIPAGVDSQLGDDYLQNLGGFDLLVRTPGLHPRNIVAANPESPGILHKVTSNSNEFLRVCPTKNVVGVTGTKGKGTTSTLITKILEAAGKAVHLGGNIGVAPLDLLKSNIATDDWVVLELSNFQLIDVTYSPHIAVCLMIVPEHLNWHADFAEYLEAKRQLFVRQSSDDLMVYNAGNSNSIELARASQAQKLWYKVPAVDAETSGLSESLRQPDNKDKSDATVIEGHVYMEDTEICSVDEIALLGRHNWENICAAIAATWSAIDHDRDAVRSIVTTFKGLPHRLELVRELNGVKYYDDSFGTTPETAIVAIRAFESPKIVILGGSDKGAQYDELAEAVASNNVRQAICIGQTGSTIQKALQAADFKDTVYGVDTMRDIVRKASEIAQPGDVVILSTACASFDMFANYKDRGEQFSQAVQLLS